MFSLNIRMITASEDFQVQRPMSRLPSVSPDFLFRRIVSQILFFLVLCICIFIVSFLERLPFKSYCHRLEILLSVIFHPFRFLSIEYLLTSLSLAANFVSDKILRNKKPDEMYQIYLNLKTLRCQIVCYNTSIHM